MQPRRLTEVGHAVALLQYLQRARGGVLDNVCQLVAAHGQGRVGVVQLVQPLHLSTGVLRHILVPQGVALC